MSERFYVNSPLMPGPVQLTGAEAHHLARVRRFKSGDQISLFNGDGREYVAIIQSLSRGAVVVEIASASEPVRELPCRLEVAAPLPKGERAQFLIEKLTELGVTTYVPLRTARSIVDPGQGKQQKLERYVIEASKQCGRNVLMAIKPPEDWAEYCRRTDLPAERILAQPGGTPLEAVPVTDMAVAVGPEGGFVEHEILSAQAAGWRPARLGPRTLRIETAAVARV